MSIPGLTKELIQSHTAEGSFERGEDYYRNGAVQHIEESDHTITARVKGGYYVPYAVHVSYSTQGITEVRCTCPYFEGSWCKHIVATLLFVLNEDQVPPPPPPLREQLEDLDREQLMALIEDVADARPELLRQLMQALRDEK